MMNQLLIDKLNDALAGAQSFTGHKYRLGLAKVPDVETLGAYYCYVQRKVSGVTQPYIREKFGEWMTFLEISIVNGSGKGNVRNCNTDPFGTRITTESLLDMIYAASVVPERGVLRAVLGIYKDLGYVLYGVDVVGRDDHLEVTLKLRGATDIYHIDLTVNTK